MITKINFKNDGTADVTALSNISGELNTMTMKMTKERHNKWVMERTLIHNAFPNLTADEREFLMTGILPGEWEELFKETTGDGIDPTNS